VEDGSGLAGRLRQLREEAGLTKTALARPRYTTSHVSQIEAGRRRPSPEALKFFSERLGVSARFLETGVPDGAEQELRHLLEEARRLVVQGDLAQAEAIARSVVARSGEFALDSLRTRALVVMGDALGKGKQLRDAIEVYEQALEGELPERERGTTVASLAATYRAMGDLAYASEIVESYLREGRGAPLDPGILAELQTVLVSIYFERGEVVRAETTARRAVKAAEEDAPAAVRARAYWNASRVLAEARRWDDALELAARARIILENEEDRVRVGRLHNAFAYLCLEADPPRVDEARDHLNRAEALLADASPGDLAYVYEERGRLALFEGAPEAALRWAESALAEVGEDELEAARSLYLKGRALALLARRGEAEGALKASADLFGRHGARQQEASAWRELGELRLDVADVDGAIEALRAGLAALEPRRSRA
jgi:tetratricopeptide (TPR) repeat protein